MAARSQLIGSGKRRAGFGATGIGTALARATRCGPAGVNGAGHARDRGGTGPNGTGPSRTGPNRTRPNGTGPGAWGGTGGLAVSCCHGRGESRRSGLRAVTYRWTRRAGRSGTALRTGTRRIGPADRGAGSRPVVARPTVDRTRRLWYAVLAGRKRTVHDPTVLAGPPIAAAATLVDVGGVPEGVVRLFRSAVPDYGARVDGAGAAAGLLVG